MFHWVIYARFTWHSLHSYVVVLIFRFHFHDGWKNWKKQQMTKLRKKNSNNWFDGFLMENMNLLWKTCFLMLMKYRWKVWVIFLQLNYYLISCNSTTNKRKKERKEIDTHTISLVKKEKRKLWNVEFKKSNIISLIIGNNRNLIDEMKMKT